jgi:hypothetical protein
MRSCSAEARTVLSALQSIGYVQPSGSITPSGAAAGEDQRAVASSRLPTKLVRACVHNKASTTCPCTHTTDTSFKLPFRRLDLTLYYGPHLPQQAMPVILVVDSAHLL